MQHIRKIYRSKSDYTDFIVVFAKLNGISIKTLIGERKVEFSDGSSFYLNDSAKLNKVIDEPLLVYNNSLIDFQFLEDFNSETEDILVYENRIYYIDETENVYKNGILQASQFAPLAVLDEEDYPRKVDTVKLIRRIIWSHFVLVLSNNNREVYYTNIDSSFPKYLTKGRHIPLIDKDGKRFFSLVKRQHFRIVDVLVHGKVIRFTCHASQLLFKCGCSGYLLYTG